LKIEVTTEPAPAIKPRQQAGPSLSDPFAGLSQLQPCQQASDGELDPHQIEPERIAAGRLT
jgi:hypothetical protein